MDGVIRIDGQGEVVRYVEGGEETAFQYYSPVGWGIVMRPSQWAATWADGTISTVESDRVDEWQELVTSRLGEQAWDMIRPHLKANPL